MVFNFFLTVESESDIDRNKMGVGGNRVSIVRRSDVLSLFIDTLGGDPKIK